MKLTSLQISCVGLLLLISSTTYAEPATKPVVSPGERATAVRPRPRGLPAGATMELDLKYGSVAGRGQLLDLYLPEAADASSPLIVWVHGGGWIEGDKRDCPAIGMVARGYAVASLNYRLSTEAIFPAQIQDCKGAIRWLRAHSEKYKLDKHRFGAWGASAGGHLVALLGTGGDAKEIEGDIGGNLDQSSNVQCVIDWFGPTDLSVFFEQANKGMNVFKGDPDRSPITVLFGGVMRDHMDLVRLANPITFIKKTTPPFLIMHGDKDPVVPLGQSEILAEALKKNDVDVTFEVLEGAGHGNGFDRPTILPLMMQFMDKHLKRDRQ